MHETFDAPATGLRLRLRRFRPAAPPRVDVLIAAAFVALSLAESVASPNVESPVLHAALAGAAMTLLAWRRQAPLLVAVAVIASHLVLNPDGDFSVLLSLVLVAYTTGSETEPPRSYLGLAVVVVPFVAVSIAEGLEPSDLAAALVFLVGPWTVGTAVRQRALRTAEAVDRAERLEREQATALEEERTRIARELHDIVSHSISVVTIQTQAVRRRLGPEQAREAADLAAVEATAREALAEMRRLFGVLRSDGEAASLAPQPGLGELDRLVGQVRAAGLAVDVDVRGARQNLSPGVDLAAYRIVQEALTNALRHSGARTATVTVQYTPRTLELAVEDDGRGMAGPPAGGGHGLVGLRERVALYGGTLTVGPAAAGGVRLAATLELTEQP